MSKILGLIITTAIFSACAVTPVGAPSPLPTPLPTASPTPVVVNPVTLSWEKDHPERATWSKELYKYLEMYWSYDDAKDVEFFYPKWKSASRETKMRAMAEMWISIAIHESGWNPKSASVDVGSKDDKGSWSIGLLQMSVNDQPNYGFKFGYTYEDLLTPGPNFHLALAIMQRQIKKYGVIRITKGNPDIYWATIYKGGKYDHSDEIAARIQKYVP